MARCVCQVYMHCKWNNFVLQGAARRGPQQRCEGRGGGGGRLLTTDNTEDVRHHDVRKEGALWKD